MPRLGAGVPRWYDSLPMGLPALKGNRKESVIGFDNTLHKWLGIVVLCQCAQYFMPPHKRCIPVDTAKHSGLTNTVAFHHALEKLLPFKEVLFRPAQERTRET